jgi:hypothetical protein
MGALQGEALVGESLDRLLRRFADVGYDVAGSMLDPIHYSERRRSELAYGGR